MFTYPIAFFKSAASVVWTPAELFASSEEGAWYDPSDLSTLFQDATATTPAGVGDPVRYIADKSGNGNHAVAANDAQRPVLRQSGSLYYLEFDGVDDRVSGTVALSQPFTIATGQTNTSTDTQKIVVSGTAASEGYVSLINKDFRLYAGSNLTSLSDVLPWGENAVTVSLFNGASSYARANGSSAISGDPGSQDWSVVTIGGYLLFYTAPVYSVVAIDRELTVGEIASLEAYLAEKTGVTL